jgi:hypothetical protein
MIMEYKTRNDGPRTNNILLLLASISKIRCFLFRLFVARITQKKIVGDIRKHDPSK